MRRGVSRCPEHQHGPQLSLFPNRRRTSRAATTEWWMNWTPGLWIWTSGSGHPTRTVASVDNSRYQDAPIVPIVGMAASLGAQEGSAHPDHHQLVADDPAASKQSFTDHLHRFSNVCSSPPTSGRRNRDPAEVRPPLSSTACLVQPSLRTASVLLTSSSTGPST